MDKENLRLQEALNLPFIDKDKFTVMVHKSWIFQINNQLAWSVGIMTNTFYQYNAGFLDEEQYIVFQKRVAQFRQNCAFRTQVNQTLFFAEQSFVDYWDSLPDNCEPE